MKSFTILVVPFFLLVPVFVSAQESTALPNATEATAQLVADVNLQDCTYTQASSADQLLTMKCSITNNLGNQGDIRYGVQLVKKTANTQEIVDTEVYSEVLSLGEKQTIQKSIEYIPPSYLSGKYELWGILKTTNGLPLSSNLFGTVTLKASSSSYLEIKSSTCSITVTNEEGNKTYSINQSPIINPNDSAKGSCSVVSHSTVDITVTPAFVTYKGSIFGETISDSKDVQQSVVFKNNETKTVSFILPKASVPQSYDTVLSLVSSDKSVASNEVVITYLLSGASATIQNVVLDKNYYSKGDTATVSVFWTGSTATSLMISIKDSSNDVCAKETSFPVTAGGIGSNGLTDYPVSITRGCANPQAIIKIVGADGSVLAEKTVGVTSEQVPENALQSFLAQKTTLYYGLSAAALVILIFGGMMLMKNRKKHYENY